MEVTMYKSESLQIDTERSPMVSLRDRIKGLYWGGFEVGWTPNKWEAEKIKMGEALRITKKMRHMEIVE